MTTMKTTSAQIAVALGKVCGMVQVAKRAKELVVIQNNTGIVTMTKEREALTLALEALEANQPVNYCMNNNGEKFPMMQEDPFKFERNTKAITAIKEALAQPEQEPVAWVCHGVNGEHDVDFYENEINSIPVGTMLYTTPPYVPTERQRTAAVGDDTCRAWVGLDDDEVREIYGIDLDYKDGDYARYARAIEAKLKEKNT